MNDQEAIKSLKKGDLSGMDALVLTHQDKALRTAFLITRDDEMAKDAVQESFLRIYQRIWSLDDSRPFEPYLMRCVINTALNMAEKVRREIPLQEEIDPDNVERLINQAASTEDLVEYAQLKEQLTAALDQLPPRERVIIVERYYLGMSEKEMAKWHDIAPGTIKWVLNTARRRLRSLIGMEND